MFCCKHQRCMTIKWELLFCQGQHQARLLGMVLGVKIMIATFLSLNVKSIAAATLMAFLSVSSLASSLGRLSTSFRKASTLKIFTSIRSSCMPDINAPQTCPHLPPCYTCHAGGHWHSQARPSCRSPPPQPPPGWSPASSESSPPQFLAWGASYFWVSASARMLIKW